LRLSRVTPRVSRSGPIKKRYTAIVVIPETVPLRVMVSPICDWCGDAEMVSTAAAAGMAIAPDNAIVMIRMHSHLILVPWNFDA
jgi:hypothetical protein